MQFFLGGTQGVIEHKICLLVFCTQMPQRDHSDTPQGLDSQRIFGMYCMYKINDLFHLHLHISQFPGVTIKLKMTNCSAAAQDSTRSSLQCKWHAPLALRTNILWLLSKETKDERECYAAMKEVNPEHLVQPTQNGGFALSDLKGHLMKEEGPTIWFCYMSVLSSINVDRNLDQ